MALNTLLSYAMHAKTDVAAFRAAKVCGRVLIDSGAFTAHTTGKPIHLDAYAEYLEHWRGSWDHAVALDVIGDPEATAKNTRILHARGLPVMPVFTLGGTLAEFDAMVADHGYVCVGGLVGMRNSELLTRRIAMLQRRAQERGGGIHALGIASMEQMRASRIYSADASTLSKVTRFGAIVWFDGAHLQQTTVGNVKKIGAHRDHIRAHGIDLAAWQRAGRYPGGPEAVEFRTCMAAGYAAAAEHLTRRFQVPPPAGLEDTAGTHLYVAALNKDVLASLTECDRRIHSDDAPRVWRMHGRDHRCEDHQPSKELPVHA